MPDQQFQTPLPPSPFRAGIATGVAKVNLANVPQGILTAATIEVAGAGVGALAGLALPIPGGALSGAIIGSQAAEAYLLYFYFRPLIEKGLITVIDIFTLCSPHATQQERDRIWFQIGEHVSETALQLVLSRGIGKGLNTIRKPSTSSFSASVEKQPGNFHLELSAHLSAALRSSQRSAIAQVRFFLQSRGVTSNQLIDGVRAFLKESPPISVLAGLRIAEIAPDDEAFQAWIAKSIPGFTRTFGGSGRQEREFSVTTPTGKTYWTLPISAVLDVPANTSQAQIVAILRDTPVRLYAERYYRARLSDLPPLFERGSRDYVTLLRRLNIETVNLPENLYMNFPDVAPGMGDFNETINREYLLRCLLGQHSGPVTQSVGKTKFYRRFHALSPDQIGSVALNSPGPISLIETYAGSGYNLKMITTFAKRMGVQMHAIATDNKSYDSPSRVSDPCSITTTKFHDVITVGSHDERLLPAMPPDSRMLTIWPCGSNFRASSSIDEDVVRFPGKMFFLVPGDGWLVTPDAVISHAFEKSVTKYISEGWRLKAVIPDGNPIHFGYDPHTPGGYLFVFERSP